jgi:hypothetical protein
MGFFAHNTGTNTPNCVKLINRRTKAQPATALPNSFLASIEHYGSKTMNRAILFN